MDEVLHALHLDSQHHPLCPEARILTQAGSSLAAILEQGPTFRADRNAIETLKGAERDLPIIYVARTALARRETAIRRLGIHYFLAHPLEREELRLVLEVLVRSSVSATVSCERFFPR